MARGLQSAGRAWFSSAGRGAVLVLRRSESRVYKCRDKRRVTGGGAASTQRFHEPRLCPAAAASTLPGGYLAVQVAPSPRRLPRRLRGGPTRSHAVARAVRTLCSALSRQQRVMAGGRSHGRASGRASGRRACVRPSLRSSTSRRSKNVIAPLAIARVEALERHRSAKQLLQNNLDAPCH